MNEGFYLILLGAYLLGISFAAPRDRMIYSIILIVLGVIAYGIGNTTGLFHLK